MSIASSGSGGTRSIAVETGHREIGDRCPNCDWPTDVPVEGVFPVVMEVAPPSSATWTCTHCGWTMKSSRHGADNHRPRPGLW
jgi:hypothetical protein